MKDIIEHYGTGQFKLKSYVYFGQTDQGVFFEAGNDSFVLKGKGLYPIVSKFMQVMDSGAVVTEFITQVPDKLQTILMTLFMSLHQKKMLHPVYDTKANTPINSEHTLSNELQHFAEDNLGVQQATAGLLKWKNTSVALVGQGVALKSACKALIDSSVKHVDVFYHDIDNAFMNKDEVATLAQTTSNMLPVIAMKANHPQEQDISNVDLVLIVSDNCNEALFIELQDWAGKQGKDCFLATVFEGEALCLPLLKDRTIGLDDILFWTQSRKTEADHSPASLSILGCIAVQHLLCHSLGIDVESLSHSFTRVSPHLEITSHPLLAAISEESANRQSSAYNYPNQFQLPDDRELADYEIYKMHLAPWFDEKFGCLALGSDEHVRQVPLFQFPISISIPGDKSSHVYGWGVDLAQAGISALSFALSSLLTVAYPKQKMTVAFDETQWQTQARSNAIVSSQLFAKGYQWIWLNKKVLTDANSQMLLRLLSYQTTDDFGIQLLTLADADTYVAQIVLHGERILSTSGSTQLEAIHEALGQCCSHFQLQDTQQPTYWQTLGIGFDPQSDRPALEDLDALQKTLISKTNLKLSYHRVNPFGFPDSVICGYAAVEQELS
jgi:hypothetical protein